MSRALFLLYDKKQNWRSKSFAWVLKVLQESYIKEGDVNMCIVTTENVLSLSKNQ